MNTRSAIPRAFQSKWSSLVGSLLIVFSLLLLAAAFRSRLLGGLVSSVLFALLLIAFCVAIFLHVRFLVFARHEQRETDGLLDVTGREFQSIFDSALDSILILDDAAICVEANPAALQLLGVGRPELVAQSIRTFYSKPDNFERAWENFRSRKEQHGEFELVRPDGLRISVEYTAKTNYLPGRHVAILRDVSLRKQTEAALRESEERFQQMANHIREVYWMIDAKTKHAVYVNPAYETITGRSIAALREDPLSYQEALHPEDRVRILTRLEEAARTGEFDEEFRIIRPNLSVRWVSARGVAVKDSAGAAQRLVGIVQDISARKSAEVQMAKNLSSAEAARAEADAFRKTTLALTQNLKMNCVLDSLLESLLQLVPCGSARVLLVESDANLFVARERQLPGSKTQNPEFPSTLDAKMNRFLMRVLTTKNSLLVPDTTFESDWSSFVGSEHMRSWLCVPLVASQRVLGLLSLGDTCAHFFTAEHLRLTKSLAIPAAVAIQNARLYERAEIYSFELEQRLADLKSTERALAHAVAGRTISENKFARVFQGSPIAFSIASVSDGRFLDVNQAFERRYGYSLKELRDRTIFDLGTWDNASDGPGLLEEICKQGSVRNRMARFRTRSGELIDTIYSADIIELDGRPCVLAFLQDMPVPANPATSQRTKTADA
jgi:PAS domain S-box-containing protein